MNIKKDILWRVYLVYIVICLGGAMILFKAFQIRYFETLKDGRSWVEYDREVRKTKQERAIEPMRGNVYAEDGNVLATSYPIYEIRFDPMAANDDTFDYYIDSLAFTLSKYFKRRSKEEEKERLLKAKVEGKRYVLINRRVTYPQLKEVKKFPLFKKGTFAGGFIIIQKNKRIKPFNRLAHRTIGYVREGVAVGLEGYYNSLLSGVPGRRWEQKVAGGKWIPINDENIVDPVPGSDLYTTLDTYIQDIADNALGKAMMKHKADHGSVIVMEVATGKIKALANLAKTKNGDYFESYNFAIGEGTEPGSTMKLMSTLALLEDGFMNPNDSIDVGNGSVVFYDKVLHDSDKKSHGKLSMREAFAKSSNVYFAKALDSAFRDRPHEYIKFLRQAGLHGRTGVDIKGEPLPFIKDPSFTDHKDKKAWTGITLPWMSIGYELKITPIQMLNLYNAVANGGKLMRPYLVNQVVQDGDLIEGIAPRVLSERICSKKVQAQLEEMMLLPVEDEKGTARNIRNKHFRIAGKTSTCKIAKKGNYGKVYQASFAGYFPADDPIYSCIVVVNAPTQGGYYGSSVAAPVFSEIAEKVYSKKILAEHNVHNVVKADHFPYVKSGKVEDIEALCDEYNLNKNIVTNKDWVKPYSENGALNVKERSVINSLVPDVKGLGVKDALFLLENQGLKVKIVGRQVGKVRRQSIHPGVKARSGLIIELVVS